MKARFFVIGALLLLCASCHTPTREARRMVKRAERLADTLPDSTASLIDSVLRMPASFTERERMDMALLQSEVIFRDIALDDDNLLDSVATSPELERAASYYAKKKQYAKAAHAALFSGYIQMHYGENETAMHSLKEAEQFSTIVSDSLTTARAQYWMAKLLYSDGMEQEAITNLKAANQNIGNRFNDKALILNAMATGLILTNQYDSAEICIKQSLVYADRIGSEKTKRKASNNFAVLCRLQEKYDDAIAYLRQVVNKSNPNEADLIIYYLNLAKTYVATKEMDSASAYFKSIEMLLPNAKTKEETKVSAYGALSQFAEQQGDALSALQYGKEREGLLSEIMDQRQEQALFRIQKQYDYETLRNTMNQKLVRRHRITIMVSIVAILGLIAFALSRIRIAEIHKQETAAKTSLFHFMQQNKELAQKQESSEKALSNLSLEHEASMKAYQELMQQNEELKAARDEYAQHYSNALDKNALIIRKLGIYLDNKGEAAYLADLKEASFGKNTPWDALMEVFDTLYPDVRKNLTLQHPELTEMEQKDFILSFFNISRDEEAVMFKKTVHMVDKVRNSLRRKMNKTAVEPTNKA